MERLSQGSRCATSSGFGPKLLWSLRGLFTRAWLRAVQGQPDLDEAWEIAERGPMPWFLADIHLSRARLFGMTTYR